MISQKSTSSAHYMAILTTVVASLVFATHEAAGDVESKRSMYSAAEVLQRVASLAGKDLRLPDLLRSLEGEASQADLRPSMTAAAEAAGLHAAAFDSWTLADLRAANGPVVLRIRPSIDADVADHYVLLEAVDGDTAMVFTGRTRLMKVPIFDLMPLWSGGGVLVTPEPLPASATYGASAGMVSVGFVLTALVGVLVFVGSLVRLRRPNPSAIRPARTAAEGVGILVAAILAGAVVVLVGGYPALDDAHATATHHTSVLIDFRDDVEPVSPIEEVDINAAELRALIAREKDLLFVDARTAKEYQKSHIENAVGLHRFDASTARLRLAGIPKDRPLVVYCININCGRGRAAATSLTKAGFTRVTHYPPGWAELKKWDELKVVKGVAPTDADQGGL